MLRAGSQKWLFCRNSALTWKKTPGSRNIQPVSSSSIRSRQRPRPAIMMSSTHVALNTVECTRSMHCGRASGSLLIDMWNTRAESMCHPLFRKELAMSPIVITDEQLLRASESACVAPLSIPRHAQDTVMQFLLSLVYGGKGIQLSHEAKRAPDVCRHRADWTRQSVNPLFLSIQWTVHLLCIKVRNRGLGTRSLFRSSL